MKKYLLLLVLLVVLPSVIIAQGFGLPPGFDLKQFQKNEEQALWFIKYDSMITRVITFDRNMAGKDFVCFQDKKGWKVVAGKLDSLGMVNTTWFQVDGKNVVSQMKRRTDTVLVASLSRAIYNANKLHAKLNIKSTSWKKYARVNLDLTITVTMYCDPEAGGGVWYGPECAWWFSSDGTNLVTTKVINQAPMMGGVTGNALNLSCPKERMPTIGTMWVAFRMMQKYPEVNIAYKTGTSTLYYNTTSKTYSWQHAAN